VTPPPLGNIFRLLAYACEIQWPSKTIEASHEHLKGLDDVLASLLVLQSEDVLRRGRHPHFTCEPQVLSAPAGRILFSSSIARGLIATRRVECDTEVVRYPSAVSWEVNEACRCLLSRGGVHGPRLRSLRQIARLTDYSTPHANTQLLRKQLARARDVQALGLVNLCRLIRRVCIPSSEGVGVPIEAADLDAVAKHRLFEAFVRGYFKHHRMREWRVHNRSMRWRTASGTEASLSRLPRLYPDVVVERPCSVMVADAKYVGAPMRGRGGAERFRSRDLYQLLAYLRNWRRRGRSRRICGLLIYASVEGEFDYTLNIFGHAVRLASVDLQADWGEVECRMRGLLFHGIGRTGPADSDDASSA
jgi:5-methylcytosine-specific restriction enzyme subunit McrC